MTPTVLSCMLILIKKRYRNGLFNKLNCATIFFFINVKKDYSYKRNQKKKKKVCVIFRTLTLKLFRWNCMITLLYDWKTFCKLYVFISIYVILNNFILLIPSLKKNKSFFQTPLTFTLFLLLYSYKAHYNYLQPR